MQKNGSADTTALAAVPSVSDSSGFNPTQDQITAAKGVITSTWAAAVS